ncbi:MAG: TlpA family protein disulfide reductase [Candidatus Kapaibacterium sp.]
MIFKNAPTTTDSVLVVNFWATWCSPCVAELPEFVHLDSVIKAQKLPARILMVSFDFKRDLQSKLIPFVSERIPALGCVLFSDSDTDAFIGSVDKEWSGSLPATLIIKQSGTCRTFMERQVSREELEQLVKSCIHYLKDSFYEAFCCGDGCVDPYWCAHTLGRRLQGRRCRYGFFFEEYRW